MDELRIGHLRVLERAMGEGSISAAARSLGLSVPTASRHLKQLEELLGVELVHRTTRQLTLTSEGELAMPHIESILKLCRALVDTLDASREEVSGALRVSVPVMLSASILGELAHVLSTRHPGLRLDVDVQNAHVDLLRDGIDVAVRIGPLLGVDGLLTRRIATLSLCMGVRPDSYSLNSNQQLLSAPLVLTRLDLKTLARGLNVGEDRIKEQAVLIVSDRLAVRDATLRGMGVGVLPQFLVRDGLERILPGLELPSGTVSALTLPSLSGDPRVVALVEALREIMESHQLPLANTKR